MTEQLTDVPVESGAESAKPILSSRTSRAAAGWVDCQEAASTQDLYREDYVPKAFRWVDPRPLWESRNDRIARWVDDPTDDERRRWVAAQRRKGVPDDLTVTRYTDRSTLTFLVLGDPGEGDASQYHVLRPARSQSTDIDFTYICSDVIYPAGDINDYYDKFYWPYQKLPGPIYAIPGNHDWYDGLHGFMAHFCGADADLRPEPSAGRSRWRRLVRDLAWRRPSEPDQELLEEMQGLRKERSDQPAPYFAIDSEPLLLVGIDTGIQGRLDEEQGEWLRQISRVPKPKLLLSGKPLVVDATVKEIPIGRSGTVNAIVDDPQNRYIAVIGGDIHNYQRYPVETGGRTIQHIVSGAAGAYTKATHKIPKVALPGCSEQDFRCYPRRGDSLAAYSRLYDKRVGFGRGYLIVPYQQAPAIMSQLLEGRVEPTRAADVKEEITPQAWKAARRITKFPGSAQGLFHRNFSEFLDWNDPPPPLFKSFLRVEASRGEVEIRCFAATGCKEHQENPPLEDWIRGREQADGTWRWEVLLD
jgi:hypothetical protein